MKLMKNITLFIFLITCVSTPGCFKKGDEPANTPAAQSSSSAVSVNEPIKMDSGNSSSASASNASSPSSAIDLSVDANGLSKSNVVLKTSKGTIKFRLYSKDAPNTVKRFVELTQQKFYNGLAFHRVVPGFVVQGGDPKSKNKNDTSVGTGGSGQKLKAEFNTRKHVRGTVAMARSADPDSADSQFYFCLGSFPHLDGNYTVIGQVYDFGEKQNDKDTLDRIVQFDEIIDMHLE